ncbi:MAG TPA: HAD-IIIA family hydrolase [Bryobacteraceae bacterium]|nr:HAD-IIIA family hydrolase [Bryobacteraceae bacterium]
MGVGTLKRAVFLDRDGVLNHAVVRNGKPYPPQTAEELRVVEDAPAALTRLRTAGFLLLVATNQPDVGRGTQTLDELQAINGKLQASLPLDGIFMCLHGTDGCECRKPKPGLLLQGAERHGVDLSGSYMIGDRWRDMDAAHAAGVAGVWIDCGYAEREPSAPPAARVKNLREAVDWILDQESRR